MTAQNLALLDQARHNLSTFTLRRAHSLAQAVCFGYKGADEVPNTYEELIAAWNSSKRTGLAFPVWSGALEHTIYTSVGANYAFRFWHASLHAKHGLKFTLSDEITIGTMQTNEVAAEFGEWSLETLLMHYDTVGQSLYANDHDGDFPIDQLTFVTERIQDHLCHGGYVSPWGGKRVAA